jgi:hypothetical protein
LNLSPAACSLEGCAVDGGKFDHKPRRLPVRGIHDVGFFNLCRAGQIENHARPTGHHEAVAKRTNQPSPRSAGPGREIEGHLRNVEDNPIRIAEYECSHVYLAIEVQDEAGLLGSPATRTSEATGKASATAGCAGRDSTAWAAGIMEHRNAAAHTQEAAPNVRIFLRFIDKSAASGHLIPQ